MGYSAVDVVLGLMDDREELSGSFGRCLTQIYVT